MAKKVKKITCPMRTPEELLKLINKFQYQECAKQCLLMIREYERARKTHLDGYKWVTALNVAVTRLWGTMDQLTK